MRGVAVVLVAAGSGTRLGARIPKAFVPLGGRPLYLHSLATFRSLPEVRQIVVVTPVEHPPLVLRRGESAVPGGARRQDSVLEGLKAVDPKWGLVLVHDAARPFVSKSLIRRVIRAAERDGAAVAAVPVRDTIKRANSRGIIKETVAREELWSAQTPQGFRRSVLWRAYQDGHGIEDATDDVQLVERAGGRVRVVEGEAANLKITSRGDLQVAEVILQHLVSDRRRRPGSL